MTRDEELTAQATRVQHRPGGLITDYFASDWLVVRCVHGKEWPEGDLFEESGGKACGECVRESWNLVA